LETGAHKLKAKGKFTFFIGRDNTYDLAADDDLHLAIGFTLTGNQ